MALVNIHQLSSEEFQQLKTARWKARTDLFYLCNKVLGYPDVQESVHGPVVRSVQKFKLPTKNEFYENDKILGGTWKYTPVVKMNDLPGDRRALILDPRSFLKTTINIQAHVIQFILNYPDITILVVQSNTEKAESILGEIKRHFQTNEVFRTLFPEHCPTKKILDWCTKAEFTTNARITGRRESTVMTGSIDKGMAGWHFDVLKFSDIVEPANIKTKEQIKAVIKAFGEMENLVVDPKSWMYVEGTRYHFGDLYGKIIDDEMKYRKETGKKGWHLHIRGAYKKDVGKEDYKFDYDEMGAPDLFVPTEDKELMLWPDHPKQTKQSWWPDRWTVTELERYRSQHGDLLFFAHKLNNPTAADDASQVPFPINDEYPKVISRENFYKNVRIAYHTISVDTAETKNRRSDYTVISVIAWDKYGRPYVVDILRAKYMPDEIVQKIIMVCARYKPLSITVEETGFVRGLKPALDRIVHAGLPYLDHEGKVRSNVGQINIPIKYIKRENDITKEERILNTLQPWYKSELRFISDLTHLQDFKFEAKAFPLGNHDDILDSLADHFQDKVWSGREAPRPSFQQFQNDEMDRWLGTTPINFDNPNDLLTSVGGYTWDRTGLLS